MGRYDMNTDPGTWPHPDDVDTIQAQEAFEATDDYAAAVRDFLATSDAAFAWGSEAFRWDAGYDQAFDAWRDR